MVAIKFLGIIVAFQIIIVHDAIAQNFYPARYGKREENDLQVETLFEGKRLGRNNEQNPITDRKIRFFISGGRYGKRGCSSDKCYQGGGEGGGEISYGLDREPNDRINIPIRKNQFMMGSRFGKRFDIYPIKEPNSSKHPWCRSTAQKNLVLRCFTRAEPRKESPEQAFDLNLANEPVV